MSDTRIYSQEKQNFNLLAVSFYANLSALLPHLASKNKLGARLVENYHKWRLKEELGSVVGVEFAEDSRGRISWKISSRIMQVIC